MKKYHFHKEKYIFGLESMRDHCSYMLLCEADNLASDEWEYYENLRDECQELLDKNAYGGLTGKEVERVKEITFERETIRFHKCLAAGMPYEEAQKCYTE